MKTILFFLLKSLFFFRKINSFLISLIFFLGNFLLFYFLISGQEFITSRLILILPLLYLLSELFLLSLYCSAIFLERSNQLDLEKINTKQTIIFLEKSRLIKKKSDIIIANLQYAWSEQSDFLDVYDLIKSKIIGLIIGLIMIGAWPYFYEQPLGIISGWMIFLLLYAKIKLEDLVGHN